MFKKRYKNRYFSTFFLSKNMEKRTIFKVNNWAKLKSINWAKLGGPKIKPNLAQLLTLKICARFSFNFKNCAETPIFIGSFLHNLFFKNKLGPIIDFENPQTWPKLSLACLRYTISAMCIAGICVAAMWCTKPLSRQFSSPKHPLHRNCKPFFLSRGKCQKLIVCIYGARPI